MKKYYTILLFVFNVSFVASQQNTNIFEFRNQILHHINKVDSLQTIKNKVETKYQKNLLFFEKQLLKPTITSDKELDSLNNLRQKIALVQHYNSINGHKNIAAINANYIKRLDAYILSRKKHLAKTGNVLKTDVFKEISTIKSLRKKELLFFETLISESKNNIQNFKDSIRIIFKKPLKRDFKSLPNYIQFQNPLRGKVKVTSHFGYRVHPISKTRKFHNGIDLVSDLTDVYSAHPGVVEKVDYSKSLGIYIQVKGNNGYTTIYGHLSKIYVLENQKVNFATEIGSIGNTGNSTGDHLHFVVKQKGKYINPQSIINQ